MNKNSQTLKKSLQSFADLPRVIKLVVLLILVISFVAGFYMGQTNNFAPLSGSIGSPSFQQKDAYDAGYNKALSFARQKVEDMGIVRSGLSESGINFISNSAIKSVRGNQITAEFSASQIDIFGEGNVTKTITIPESVQIEKRTYKSQEEIQKILDDYMKKEEEYRMAVASGKKPKNPPTAPSAYTFENVAISDLKPGDTLNVTYQADESNPNIFNAVLVELVNK
jgi:hypothetical protein